MHDKRYCRQPSFLFRVECRSTDLRLSLEQGKQHLCHIRYQIITGIVHSFNDACYATRKVDGCYLGCCPISKLLPSPVMCFSRTCKDFRPIFANRSALLRQSPQKVDFAAAEARHVCCREPCPYQERVYKPDSWLHILNLVCEF